LKGENKEAYNLYNTALDLTDTVYVKNQKHISTLINYTSLETLAGRQEHAVEKLNKVLELDSLTNNNRDLLEFFRNEFEYYQGNGNSEFDDFERDKTIKSINPDSIKILLKENHINIVGDESSYGNDTTEIYVSE